MEPAEELGFATKLTQDDLEGFKRYVDRLVAERLVESFKANDLIRNMALTSVKSTVEDRLLSSLALKTDTSPEDVMTLALTLYDLAIDATRANQRLILVDKEYRYVSEVIGLTNEQSELPAKVAS